MELNNSTDADRWEGLNHDRQERFLQWPEWEKDWSRLLFRYANKYIQIPQCKCINMQVCTSYRAHPFRPRNQWAVPKMLGSYPSCQTHSNTILSLTLCPTFRSAGCRPRTLAHTHTNTHTIDFHLDNLMFTDNSQPLHHGHPSPSLDVRACLTVICHHISSLMLSFSLCFFQIHFS